MFDIQLLDLVWVRLAVYEHPLHDSGTFFSEFWAESTVYDDVDGGVDDEEKVAEAGQIVGPFWKGLHAPAERNNIVKF
jgi:hypothetical protein